MLDDGFDVLVEVLWEPDFALQDVLVNDHGVFVGEGVDACVHFVDEDAQGPPVDSLPVALVKQNFGGQVLGSPAESVSPGFYHLGKAEVSQFQVAVLSNQQVFGLEVSKNDVLFVEVFEDKYDLSGIKTEFQGRYEE